MLDDSKTFRWWRLLCGVSLLNAVGWVLLLTRDAPRTDYRVQQLILSGLFVAVCAFRAAVPRVDLERLCLWDSRWSAIALGRSAATVAEMCFTAQCALLLDRLAEWTGLAYLSWVAALLLPLIFVAQLCCWYAVVTLNHLGHALEEVLWTVKMALLLVTLGHAASRLSGTLAMLLWFGVGFALLAAGLMAGVDIPMYVKRWRAGRAAGTTYLSIRAGLRDCAVRRRPTKCWQDWRAEVPWMSSYFSLAVWLSLAMCTLETLPR